MYFLINEVPKIVESVCFGQPAVVSVLIVRGQTVVTCPLYVNSPQILSQRSPVSEEEQRDLQRDKHMRWEVNVGMDPEETVRERLQYIRLFQDTSEMRILVKMIVVVVVVVVVNKGEGFLEGP